ncbi:hypothetical protein D3C81_1382170 [compost metagenome]
MWFPERLDVFHRRRNLPRATTTQVHKALLLGGEQASRLGFGFAGDDIQRQDRVRLAQMLRRLEIAAIQRQRFVHGIRREVRGEGEWQTHRCRQPRTEQAGTQQPHRHIHARTRHGLHALPRLRRREVMQQLGHVLRELVGTVEVAAQCTCGGVVGTRRATEAQVDASRIKRGQRAELLGDLQRRVVGQHDAAGADADGRRSASYMADQH